MNRVWLSCERKTLNRARFSRERKVHLAIFAVYFVFGFAFFAIGLQPARDSAATVYATEAETANATLIAPEIGLEAPVKEVALSGKDIEVPEQIVGSYSVHKNKTLLIGHSSTVFTGLKDLRVGAEFNYAGHNYIVSEIVEKAKDDISMKEILKAEDVDTVVLMTCSGEVIAGTEGDHTHRLIVRAEQK